MYKILCRVDDQLRVKVADFGLSRDVYHSDYYRLTHKARLPVKWMPPESVFQNIYSEKTDVVMTRAIFLPFRSIFSTTIYMSTCMYVLIKLIGIIIAFGPLTSIDYE